MLYPKTCFTSSFTSQNDFITSLCSGWTSLDQSYSHKDCKGCNNPYRHTSTVLLNVGRRSDDTCDLVDAVVAKQPSQNSMPTIDYSAPLIKLWVCLLPCRAESLEALCNAFIQYTQIISNSCQPFKGFVQVIWSPALWCLFIVSNGNVSIQRCILMQMSYSNHSASDSYLC